MTFESALSAYNARIDDDAFCARVGELQERFMRTGKTLHDAFAAAVDLALSFT